MTVPDPTRLPSWVLTIERVHRTFMRFRRDDARWVLAASFGIEADDQDAATVFLAQGHALARVGIWPAPPPQRRWPPIPLDIPEPPDELSRRAAVTHLGFAAHNAEDLYGGMSSDAPLIALEDDFGICMDYIAETHWWAERGYVVIPLYRL